MGNPSQSLRATDTSDHRATGRYLKVKGQALVIAPQVDTATTEALRYMARTKQRRTYLPYTFPAVAGTHLPTPRGWRVELAQAQGAKSNWPTVYTRQPAASGTRTHDLAIAGRAR